MSMRAKMLLVLMLIAGGCVLVQIYITLSWRVAWYLELSLLILALGAGYMVHSRLFAPIEELVAALEKVKSGDYSVRTKVRSKDEFGRLADSFNSMVSSLAASTRRFELVFEAFPHPITLIDAKTLRMIAANPVFLANSGWTREQVIGRTAVELGLVRNLEHFEATMKQLFETGRVDDLEVQTPLPNDQYSWASYSARLIEIAGEQVILSVVTDITSHKRLEASLRASDARTQLFRFMVDHANEAMMLMRDELIVECNPATLDLFNRTRDQLIGHCPAEFSPQQQPDGSDSMEKGKVYLEAALQGVPQRFEWLHSLPNGELLHAEVALNCFIDEGRAAMVGVIRDITARKQAEEALLQLNTSLEVGGGPDHLGGGAAAAASGPAALERGNCGHR